MRSIVTFLLALVAVSAHPGSSGRIVGGHLTTIDRYPDMAALLFFLPGVGFRQSCGGVIINNRSILSAAHCTFGLESSMFRVRLGSTFASSGGVVLNVAYIINHHQYNPLTFDSDICVIRVQGSIIFGPVITNARLAGPDYHVADNQVAWAAGWGRIYASGPPSEQLRHVQILTVSQSVCRERYRGPRISDNMLCAGWLGAGRRGQCSQDSGGPLYHNGVVVGVTSFVDECGSPHYPVVNVRVQRFANWIYLNR